MSKPSPIEICHISLMSQRARLPQFGRSTKLISLRLRLDFLRFFPFCAFFSSLGWVPKNLLANNRIVKEILRTFKSFRFNWKLQRENYLATLGVFIVFVLKNDKKNSRGQIQWFNFHLPCQRKLLLVSKTIHPCADFLLSPQYLQTFYLVFWHFNFFEGDVAILFAYATKVGWCCLLQVCFRAQHFVSYIRHFSRLNFPRACWF